MYWPLGVPSSYTLPKYGDESSSAASHSLRNEISLVSLSRATSGNLLATVTASELFIWQMQVRYVHPVYARRNY